MTKNVLKKFVAVAACVGFPLFIVTSANAQTTPTPAPAAGEATTERVIVTGSNIPTTETEAALPVTVYSAEVLQKNGANTPAEGLRQLPSYVGNTNTENDSNGGNGAASVTLRGLGPNNTLTLINGRRTNIFSNINAIPVGALSRAEILKDGASSVYGSDAVAGVVNFILLNGGGDFFNGDPPYEGAEVFLLYGNTSTDDARVLQGYMRGGVTALDGKVAIAAAGEYYNRLDIFSRDRNVSASADTRHLGGANNASPTYAGRVQYRTSGTETVQGTLIDQTTVNPNNTTPGNPGATYRVFDAAAPNTDPDRFNFRAFTPAIPGQEKAEYYVTGRLKIFDDMLQMYGDILYAKTKQNNGLAAAPFALNSVEGTSSPFSPFTNPDGDPNTTSDNQLQQSRYRLVNDLGPRRTLFDDDYYRYTIGFAGEFNMTNNQFVSNWGYDTGFVYERQQEIRVDSGDAKRSAIVAAISGIDTTGTGAPPDLFFDPFIGQNAPVTGTATTYVNGVASGTHTYDNKAAAVMASYIGHSIFKERDFAYDAKANGNFFPELWNGGVGASIGYEHRHSGQESIPDPVQVAGDQLGFNQSPLDKFVQEVDSYFGEVRLPLITSTQNISWMRSLELDFAYRYEEFEDRNQDPFTVAGVNFSKSKFNNGGDPRISIRIQPIEDVILRGSWGKSFRSPFPINLFLPPSQNFPQLFDPANHGSGTFQPPGGVSEEGNPNLKPEETDSYAAGIVYTPAWVRNMTGGTLTVSVDFYQEFTNNVILSPDQEAQVLLTQSVNSSGNGLTTDPDGPGLGAPSLGGGGPMLGVTRNADGPGGTLGTVQTIDSAYTNAGKRLVNGLDLNAVYQLPTSNWGTFTWTLGYNYFFTWKASAAPGSDLHSFLGDYNNGTLPLAPGAIPYHKGFLRWEWEGTTGWMRGFDFVANGNYISSFNDDSAFLLPKPTITNHNPDGTLNFLNPSYSRYRRVTDYITLDMQLSYEFKKPVTEAAVASYSKDSKDGKNAMAPVGGADNGTFAQRMLWNTKFTVGVNNAFDREPPSVLGAFNDTYDTSLYSIRDRFYYISLAKKF